MKPLSRLTAVFATVTALSACAENQPAKCPDSSAQATRADLTRALSEWNKEEGVLPGEESDVLYSLACTEEPDEYDYAGGDFMHREPVQNLFYRFAACPDDGLVFKAYGESGSMVWGHVLCEGVMIPRKVFCDGVNKAIKAKN